MSKIAAKMAEVAIEAKAIEYLSAFLEKASEMALKGSLRAGMSLVCRIPLVDILVDKMKELELNLIYKMYKNCMLTIWSAGYFFRGLDGAQTRSRTSTAPLLQTSKLWRLRGNK